MMRLQLLLPFEINKECGTLPHRVNLAERKKKYVMHTAGRATEVLENLVLPVSP